MKQAFLYARVSTFDQNPQTQLLDLRRLAEQRGFEIVREYVDKISGAKAKRPALDQMLAAAHRRECDVVLVWAADRLARSVRHFLEVLDTLNHLGIEFVSFRENLDTGGPLGRAVVVIVSAVADFNGLATKLSPLELGTPESGANPLNDEVALQLEPDREQDQNVRFALVSRPSFASECRTGERFSIGCGARQAARSADHPQGNVVPGPTADVYAFTRETVQRNLYRIPVR